MEYFENYGVIPPENSKPIWGKDNPSEDDIVTLIDFKNSLQKLTFSEREVIKLFNQGYSEREIASLLNMNDTAVHRIKAQAVKKLKEMLNGEDTIHGIFT